MNVGTEAANDATYGLSSDDTIRGGADNDNAYGRSGNDTLNGGDGTDYLHGDRLLPFRR